MQRRMEGARFRGMADSRDAFEHRRRHGMPFDSEMARSIPAVNGRVGTGRVELLEDGGWLAGANSRSSDCLGARSFGEASCSLVSPACPRLVRQSSVAAVRFRQQPDRSALVPFRLRRVGAAVLAPSPSGWLIEIINHSMGRDP